VPGRDGFDNWVNLDSFGLGGVSFGSRGPIGIGSVINYILCFGVVHVMDQIALEGNPLFRRQLVSAQTLLEYGAMVVMGLVLGGTTSTERLRNLRIVAAIRLIIMKGRLEDSRQPIPQSSSLFSIESLSFCCVV